MARRITGRKENDTGGNTHYKIGDRVVRRTEAVKMVKNGNLPGYHTVKINGVNYLRDNPDKREGDNIDSQPLI
ncbi:MAG: DUF3892 domain-containing protein [Candidatus Omnitrophica bacterium]|nr:DUF3892 domain-containing protein [Candidatus Omnitrophota bacterium]